MTDELNSSSEHAAILTIVRSHKTQRCILLRKPDKSATPQIRAYYVGMVKLETIVTVMADKRIIEAKCSICHELILASGSTGTREDQEAKLREAISRHATQRHSLSGPIAGT